MIDKKVALEKLENEKQFAKTVGMMEMALGLAEAIKIIKGIKSDYTCAMCGEEGDVDYMDETFCFKCLPPPY